MGERRETGTSGEGREVGRHSKNLETRRGKFDLHGNILSCNCASFVVVWFRELGHIGKEFEKIESVHKQAVRYMMGQHIRKRCEDWEYLEHRTLLHACGLFPIETYIEHRRGTLWEYMKSNRNGLTVEAGGAKKHCKKLVGPELHL